jgi:hypothetical protein
MGENGVPNHDPIVGPTIHEARSMQRQNENITNNTQETSQQDNTRMMTESQTNTKD